MSDVMTVAELIDVLSGLNPKHEVYVLDVHLREHSELRDVRVDDGAGRVTLIGVNSPA